MTTEPARPLGPSSGNGRIELFDILRGFAILGILLVNFRGPVTQGFQALDQTVSANLNLLVLGSFYPLFSFLFGLGFAIQLRRAESRAEGVTLLWIRRLAVLLLIGTAHAVLVWSGDILVDYALVGLLLVPLSRLPMRGIAAVILVLFVVQLQPGRFREVLDRRGTPTVEAAMSEALAQGVRAEDARVRSDARMLTGRTFAVDVEVRWERYAAKLSQWTDPAYLLTRDLLMIFLIGFWVGRRRWLEAGRKGLPAFVAIACVGAAAAVLGNLPIEASGAVQRLLRMLANYGVTVFYVAAISAAVAMGGAWLAALRVFAPVGRTALSNYLLQSVVMTWMFLPYGIGRGYPAASLFVLLHLVFFFAVQVPLSQWWLDRFRFGPVEWAWRCMVYGRVFVNRVRGSDHLVGQPPAAEPVSG